MQGNLRHRAMQGACLTLLVAGIVVQTVRAAPTPSGTVKYGIVFDAGSSGSRIHVYSWRVGGGGPKDAFDLIADDLLKKKPGLSAYKDKPAEAGSSLRELLDHAKSKIPQNLHAETPVFLMAAPPVWISSAALFGRSFFCGRTAPEGGLGLCRACPAANQPLLQPAQATAGLRMVGETIKDQILASVCAELSSSGFLFQCEWATLLSGTDEGLYGWVTVNYLLDTLYPPANSPPVGIIDLGGGSVQVVFAASQGSGLKHMDFGGCAARLPTPPPTVTSASLTLPLRPPPPPPATAATRLPSISP
jgi:hypothetical protein